MPFSYSKNMEKFDRLGDGYVTQQQARIAASFEQILNAREAKSGRTLPDPDSIRISDGRRLKVAVLFLDISSFSDRPMCHESEQSEVMKCLAFFFAEFIRIIRDFGGKVEKNTGDGLMAYFEDADRVLCSKRATAASLTMIWVAENVLNPMLDRHHFAPFHFRICADVGEVTIARIGSPQTFSSLVAIGTTANCTGKMLSKAIAGEFLVGERMARELPLLWQNNFVAWSRAIHSGFRYRASGDSYTFVPYTGRWSR